MITTILISINLVLLLVLFFKINNSKNNNQEEAVQRLLKNEFKENRSELLQSLKDNRDELAQGIDKLTSKLEEKLEKIKEGLDKNAKDNRFEMQRNLKDFSEVFSKNVKDFNELQKDKFADMSKKQELLVKATENRLDQMRETVDEKLSKTLEERLGRSFKLVSERLEAVQKGLGEMQSLANGVGDLKKVLTNVKTRGVLGEIQLGNILEQIMSPEQYEANVKTKEGSNDLVEFAIKLPGRNEGDRSVYLPIDAKFPQEDYVRLQNAFEEADQSAVESAQKALVQAIKRFAKDIHTKYIDPPHTTDFGIMFLPVEGLYAEVVKQPDLIAFLQREYKIIITGPTTLAAMLNSLQMGFKTLAIQKRSSEVWQVLGAVKKEFQNFGGVLEKAQKKITEANSEIDKLVGTRTRMMMSKLKKIEKIETDNSIDQIDLLDN